MPQNTLLMTKIQLLNVVLIVLIPFILLSTYRPKNSHRYCKFFKNDISVDAEGL